MSSEFIQFTSNLNDWNFIKMIKTPDIDPFKTNKKLNDSNLIH